MRSGSVCNRRNKTPNATTLANKMKAVTTMRTSVSPGAVMKIGRWCGAAGLSESAMVRLPSAPEFCQIVHEDRPVGHCAAPSVACPRHILQKLEAVLCPFQVPEQKHTQYSAHHAVI